MIQQIMLPQANHVQGLENWQAWAGAGVGLGLRVHHRENCDVVLSRWDIHTIVENATEAVFATSGAGGRSTIVRGFAVGRGATSGTAVELSVRRPAGAVDWIQEVVALADSGSEKLFQVGTWIIRVGPPDYRPVVVASTDEAAANAYRSAGDDFKAMYKASSQCKDKTAVLLGFLQNEPLQGTPAELARIAVAMLVVEAARNHHVWGVNLMLLDLLRQNAVPGGFGAVVQNELHPMSKSGTHQSGKVGLKGERTTRDAWAHETGITAAWLCKFAGIEARLVEGSNLRWQNPPQNEAMVAVVRRRLTDTLVARFRKVNWAWE